MDFHSLKDQLFGSYISFCKFQSDVRIFDVVELSFMYFIRSLVLHADKIFLFFGETSQITSF